MAKLYFRYGTMASGKSLDLLKVVYNYEENNRKVIVFTSGLDYRCGYEIIRSRTGLEKPALSISSKDNLFEIVNHSNDKIDCVIVDEVQFFNTEQIYQLSDIVDKLDIPVICYGLRSDYKLNFFEGSVVLMGLADNIEEIKTICSCCSKKKAIINAKIDKNGKIVTKGKQIEIGGNEKYKPMCRTCYKNNK